MIDRDILIELLAIKLYEHDSQSGKWPPPRSEGFISWSSSHEEDREAYRERIRSAPNPAELFAPPAANE